MARGEVEGHGAEEALGEVPEAPLPVFAVGWTAGRGGAGEVDQENVERPRTKTGQKARARGEDMVDTPGESMAGRAKSLVSVVSYPSVL